MIETDRGFIQGSKIKTSHFWFSLVKREFDACHTGQADQLCSHCGLQLLIYSWKLGFQGVLDRWSSPRGCWSSPAWKGISRAPRSSAIGAALASGAGVEKFREIIANQGGDPAVIDDYDRMPSVADRDVVVADRDGVVTAMEAEAVDAPPSCSAPPGLPRRRCRPGRRVHHRGAGGEPRRPRRCVSPRSIIAPAAASPRRAG